MSVATLVKRAAEKGIVDFGISDHLHTPYNWPDIEASRREFLQAISQPEMQGERASRFHFGIEVSVVSQWEIDEIATGKHKEPVYGLREGGPIGAPLAIALTPEHIDAMGIEYVVGGTHWPLYVPVSRESMIREYHRQNMFLATHPLVTIVAHPWWWMGHWRQADGRYMTDPWLDDFKKVPQSIHDELGAAIMQHGKVFEINLCAIVLNKEYPETFAWQYLEVIAELYERGVTMSIGSDCHNADYAIAFDQAERMLEKVGIDGQRLWKLPPRV